MTNKIECKLCQRSWEEVCEQTLVIKHYGRCIVCLTKENPIDGLDWKEVEKFLETNRHKLSIDQTNQ